MYSPISGSEIWRLSYLYEARMWVDLRISNSASVLFARIRSQVVHFAFNSSGCRTELSRQHHSLRTEIFEERWNNLKLASGKFLSSKNFENRSKKLSFTYDFQCQFLKYFELENFRILYLNIFHIHTNFNENLLNVPENIQPQKFSDANFKLQLSSFSPKLFIFL